ncbi:MAG: alpha/beta fold hydrolase [Mangrovicoccus sp.]
MNTTVWIHGAGLSPQTWNGRAYGITLELPGHGIQPRVQTPSVEAFAEELKPYLPDQFALVGHSLGGMISMVLAAELEGRVTKLVLAETAYNMRGKWTHRLGTWAACRAAKRRGPGAVAEMAAKGESLAAREVLRNDVAQMQPEGFHDALTATRFFDGSKYLNKLTMPTLILAGKHNKRTHVQARDMARILPNARLEMLDSGHFPHVDAPDAFFGEIEQFLAGEQAPALAAE